MKISDALHHFWTATNVGSLFFTAAVYVGLLLYSSAYTPAPCQSFIDALGGNSAGAADILMSEWFRIWELIFVLFQVGLLLGYFTLHGIMAFYENPEEAHKFLVLSAEIFFGWSVFAFRIFGLESTTIDSGCTEVDVAPPAYWVINASSMLFSPLIGVVAVQVAIHCVIFYMEHRKNTNVKVLNVLNLAIKVFEILLGAFGLAMCVCYGIWAKNPWVRAAIWVAVANVVMNQIFKFKMIPIWRQEINNTHHALQEEPHHYDQVQLVSTQYRSDYVKDNNYNDDISPYTAGATSYPPSAQLKSAGLANY